MKDYFVKKMGPLEKSNQLYYVCQVKNIMKKKMIYNLQSVEDFKILQQYNTLENTFNGIYSSRLVTHDLFNKTFKEYDFNYYRICKTKSFRTR